jgi:hypothetical protein
MKHSATWRFWPPSAIALLTAALRLDHRCSDGAAPGLDEQFDDDVVRLSQSGDPGPSLGAVISVEVEKCQHRLQFGYRSPRSSLVSNA